MELTYDETLFLLDELAELVERSIRSKDREVELEQIELVFDSLEEAPSERMQERLPQIQGWAEVLMDEIEPGEAESVRTLILEELAELRSILGTERVNA